MNDTFKAPEGWTDLDRKAVDTARVLAADAVEKTGSGHPGTAVSLAPVAYLLYQDLMRHDPNDVHWPGRDRFVLSAGHACLLQYTQLYLGGFGLEKSDLESLRTFGSKTPGHPEYDHTDGVETTSGPLGQGLATAVGMAMAQRRERGLLDPEAEAGTSPFDHHTYVIASDGDMQEGITNEASSIAGTQKLGNLTVIWDDNDISIEGHTDIAFTEDVAARYEALGWDVHHVDWTQGGAGYLEDVAALKQALLDARQVTDKPSFIALRTIIGWPTPKLQDTGKIHGAAMGAEALAGLKETLGFDPEQNFFVDEDVLAHTRKLADRGAAAHEQWDEDFASWRESHGEQSALWDRLSAHELPDLEGVLPTFETDEKGIATRAASGKVLNSLAPAMPELWGGSADLAGSNNTTMEGVPSFVPSEYSTAEFSGDEYGRTLHFGIREHAMAGILTGISLHGLTRAYGGTFLQFADYQRGAVRLSAVIGAPNIYVWTHDSIGLGEDGPTHQPVEHLAAYRAIPNLSVVRPADANETAAAWRATLEHREGPVGLVLSRQAVPTFDRSEYTSADNVRKGAYIMKEASKDTPDVILMATGSEVQYAAAAQKTLEEQGVAARLVSFPSFEWFEAQSEEYRESVLPRSVTARVSVEAGIAMPWYRYLAGDGRAVSLEHYGASAGADVLFKEFGFTPEAVVEAAQASIAAAAR